MKTNSLLTSFGSLGMGAGSLMGTDPVVMPTNQVYGWKMSGPVMSVQNLPSEQEMGAPTDPCCEGSTPLQWQFLGTSNEWGSAVVLSEGTPRLDTETSGQKSVSATVRYRWKCKEDVQAKAKDALPALNWVIRVTGLEISTNGVALSSAPTNYVAWASNGAVMATARITSSDAPTNTPWNGWSFTGGSESNRLTHTVPLSTPGFTTFIPKAGESAATNTVCVMKVEVTNIKFNYDTGSSANDALNIRQDYSNAYDISNGEWVKGGVNNPICYTTNKTVTIKARFTVQPASVTSADIWAVSTDSGGSLGNVIKTNVTFSAGVSSPEYVTFQISGNTPATIKKTSTDVWQWKMENVNGAGSAACNLNTSGVHTVYTILNEPATPWVNTAGSQKNAWTKALDFAIVSASCNGDSTASTALSHIAQYLHAGHGLTYDINGGRPKYASSNLGGTMDLTGYIDKSSQLYGTAGNVINCYDQASGVCTFGRLLGVSVTYRYMSPFGYINTVNLVGEGNCNNPFYPLTTGGKVTGADEVAPVRSRFGNHAFTLLDGYVFDACAGPHLGTRTEAQYVSDTVDSSTPAEAAVAGDTSNISSGAVTDLK